jgi:hypothetical protein
MDTTLERAAHEQGSWLDEYWLCHSEGYRVDSDAGHVGYVEEVVWEPVAERPSALLVRTCAGDCATVSVPLDDVVEIRPSVELIVVSDVPRK